MKLIRKILCFFGWHRWVWRFQEGETLVLHEEPPAHAKRKYCHKRYDNDKDFEGYPG